MSNEEDASKGYCPECGCPENEHEEDGCHALDFPQLGILLDCRCRRHETQSQSGAGGNDDLAETASARQA
ncbi:hypothetical protein [Mycobacterium riyadhense]|uniref:hypothetical protein n=1 Tax=Mycobacterium riyadhense TaxID=486698 RepID=UPI0019575E64|nr:hypothetical protein [Mycobacterium riyadhense]